MASAGSGLSPSALFMTQTPFRLCTVFVSGAAMIRLLGSIYQVFSNRISFTHRKMPWMEVQDAEMRGSFCCGEGHT